MLTVFINESRDEDVKDFVVNRNPEFALTVVHKSAQEEADANEKVSKYLSNLTDKFNAVDQIKFENFNHFFKNDPEILRFCARDKKFKPGSGQFDFIFDLEEKENQTMRAKFNYLEKMPLRKFKTAKNCIGCAIGEEEQSVLIVELQDVNDFLSHDEIVKRVSINPTQTQKTLLAYVLKARADPVEILNTKAAAKQVPIPGLTETDEVV